MYAVVKWTLTYAQIISTYMEAVQTVDPQMASGKLYTLWVEFAKFYEKANQIEDVSHCNRVVIIISFVMCCVYWCNKNVVVTCNALCVPL
jgi:hypothetical protein